jgi:hypothetical protein
VTGRVRHGSIQVRADSCSVRRSLYAVEAAARHAAERRPTTSNVT